MNKLNYAGILILLLFLSGCLSRKETASLKEAKPVVEQQQEPAVYRGSYPKIVDLLHTRLDISFNWDSAFAYGKALLTCKAYFYPISEAVFDAKGFTVNEVALVENNLKSDVKYEYDGRKLRIKLNRLYTPEDTFYVYVDYVAKPNKLKKGGSMAITSDKGLYFINPQGKIPDKPRQIWTQGETEANSCWMPTIDGPQEKMTQEFFITVDTAFLTLSNGRMEYSMENGNGTRTDYWVQDLPHSTYLAMMTIGKFSVIKDKWRDMEVSYYVEPEYAPYARAIFGNTPEMIEFFSRILDVEYPWDKYAQVVVRDYVSGAMENTSAVILFDQMYADERQLLDNSNEDVISHELFHHWFGDLVTAESWSNLPLNESFATYGEYLWQEYKYGREAADRLGQNDLSIYFQTSRDKQVNLIRYYYDDKEDMFDTHSYQKGGRVLHMLRKYTGDEAFFAALKLYLDRHRFGSVEIHDLRLAFEQVTGEDMNWFFNQWFLSSGQPAIVFDYGYDETKKKAMLAVWQKQDLSKNPLYRIPLDVDIYSDGKKERRRVTVTQVRDTFWFDAPKRPDLINADAEKMLLAVKRDNKSKDELIFQYRNGPLYLDRKEALDQLDKSKEDLQVQKLFADALNDRFWSLRITALEKVPDLNAGKKDSLYQKIADLALHDPKAAVRAKAVDMLAQEYQKDNMPVFRQTINDRSYNVATTTLKAIAAISPNEALTLAKPFENVKNNSLISQIAGLYAKYGTAEQHNFFKQNLDKSESSAIYTFHYYESYLKRMDEETIRNAIPFLARISKEARTDLLRTNAKAVIANFVTIYETREKEFLNAPGKAAELKKAQEMKDYATRVLNDLEKN